MIVEIEVDGRRRTVDVHQGTAPGRSRAQAAEWMVTVDGRALRATVAEIGGRWSWLIEGPAEAGLYVTPGPNEESGFSRTWRSYEVSFEAAADGRVGVRVDGESIPLSIVDPRGRGKRGGRDATADASGPRAIVAPMPGRIVKVLVERGQTVAARQGVVVVEAMKMENELRAPRPGIVSEVHVSEGMSVEAQATLVVIE